MVSDTTTGGGVVYLLYLVYTIYVCNMHGTSTTIIPERAKHCSCFDPVYLQ